jgi:hypothetical protein
LQELIFNFSICAVLFIIGILASNFFHVNSGGVRQGIVVVNFLPLQRLVIVFNTCGKEVVAEWQSSGGIYETLRFSFNGGG